MKQFKYISNLTIDEIESNIVIPCFNEQGNPAILIKNAINKVITSVFVTDNLKVQIDTLLQFKEESYYCHIISSTKNDAYSIEQFRIIYEYIFKKIDSPILGTQLSLLITSLEDYFKVTPETNSKVLQIGVFGELLTIKYLYDYGYKKIIDKYHQNFYLRHDFELDEKNRIEIKTTILDKRIHTFRHDQIYRKDINVYVCSVMLELSEAGLSLYELFQEVLKLYNDPDSIFSLQKLMKKCNVTSENVGEKFAISKAYNDFKIFDAVELPKIEVDIPNGVTNIRYDVDCSIANDINVYEFISKIEKI